MTMYYPHLQRFVTKPEDALIIDPASGARTCKKDIYQAAIEGDVECLAVNLMLGADVNGKGQPVFVYGPRFDKCDVFAATPLHYACGYNREEAVQFLLENGANPELRSASGVTCREYARSRNYITILQLLDRYSTGQSEDNE
eukprot:GDKK01077823.1.p1 GENE.GDKK01077823.1~~GDKK01077823.1.p1  ORF type:complete len:142 (-),score=3.83 GDKK01077823.1:112-537(-)